MAHTKPTQKQLRFAELYVENGGNASEAYRQAYDASHMAPTSIYVNACKLLKNAKVQLRLAQLQQEHAERHNITIDTITQMLREDRELARQNDQASAAVSATMGLAKIHGLIVDKVKTTVHRDVSDLTDEELAAIAAAGSGRASEETESPARSAGLH